MKQFNFKKSILSVLLVLCLLFAGTGTFVSSAASTNNFHVKAVLPKNQVDKKQSYFDLRMEPSQQQTIQLVVTNPSSESIVVSTRLAIASTERNGLIVYEKEQATALEKAAIKITDIATVLNPDLPVKAKSSATVNIQINMPKDQFDGLILGGLVVTANQTAAEDGAGNQAGDNTIQLENAYNYVIGLKLTQNDKTVDPDFDLLNIRAGLVNYRTSVIFELVNLKPRLVNGMQVSAWVYKRGSSTVFRSLNLESAQMAPDSVGEFIVDWENTQLQAGKYRLKVRAEYDGKVWEWDEDFTITAGDANDANNGAVGIQRSSWWVWLCLSLLLLLLIILLAFWLGRRSVRKARKAQERKEDDNH